MERPTWAPAGIDLMQPSPARIYDFYLGGSHNFEVDRAVARRAIELWPDLPKIMQANRAFMRRAVRHAVASGITQFVDIGSGIPTFGNVHEVARAACPEARVVYVDRDPVAVAHSQAILAGDDRATVIQADMRDPEAIFGAPELRRLIDLDRPVALLLVAVLHFVVDEDDPRGLVARLAAHLPSGSELVLSHATQDGRADMADSHQQLYRRIGSPLTMRSHADVMGFFDGFELVEPGLVFFPRWRPDVPDDEEDPSRLSGLAGVGRKP